MELHPGASQTTSPEESPGPRGARSGGLPGLHRYPLIEGVWLLLCLNLFILQLLKDKSVYIIHLIYF